MRYKLLALPAAMAASFGHAMMPQAEPALGIRDNTPDLMAFTHATVVVAPGKTLKNATLVINNGIIQAVGTRVSIPKGATEIDLKGYTLYPGFIDPYTQYGLPKADKPEDADGPVYTNTSVGGNYYNDAIHPELGFSGDFEPDSKTAKKWLKNGFTSVQSAQFDGILRGTGVAVSLGQGRTNALIYNDFAGQFASFDKGSSQMDYPSSLMGSIALLRQAFSDANWYEQVQEKGMGKFNQGKLSFNAALDALVEIENQPLIFATTDTLDVLRAGKLMNDFSLKGAILGSGSEYVYTKELKAMDQSLILPLTYPDAPSVNQLDDELDVSLAELRHWERAPTNAAAVAKAQIPFALTQHGLKKTKDFWPALRKAVRHGLSKESALAALTTAPARMAGIDNQAGRLKQGYRADFVIAKGDLFENGEIFSVWTQGQRHRFKPLDTLDYAGEYALTFNGQAMTLSLTQGKKPKGKLIKDKTKISLEALSIDESKIGFKFDGEKLGIEGVVRVSAHLSAEQLEGRWSLPQGEALKLVASKVGPAKSKAETQAKGVSLLSKLTFPNVAYGPETAPKSQKLHIKNATVWTADKQGVLTNTDLLIEDGVFTRIGKDLSTPRGFAVIDANGKHVTPGIIDEHSHIAISKGVNEGSDSVTSEVAIGDVVNPTDIHIYRSLAGGTTTAQLLHGSANPIGGQAQIIQLKWGQDAEGLKFAKAPPSIKFALGENVKQSNWGDEYDVRYPQSRVGVESILRDTFIAARDYDKAWKAYNKLSKRKKAKTAPPRHNHRLEIVAQILNGERFVHTHSYVASEILMLLRLAEENGFKIQTLTHILEGYKLADEIAAHGAGASTFADWWAYKFEVYDAIPGNACLMQDKGVLTSINSDSNDLQRRLNQEAAKSVYYCGMSEEDALKLVTLNPAIQLKIDDKVGSITRGKQADFVIWDNHPLSVYAKAEQTWIAGAKYFDRARDLELRKAVEAEKRALVQKVLTADKKDKKGTGGKPAGGQLPTWHCEDNLDIWHQAALLGGAH